MRSFSGATSPIELVSPSLKSTGGVKKSIAKYLKRLLKYRYDMQKDTLLLRGVCGFKSFTVH